MALHDFPESVRLSVQNEGAISSPSSLDALFEPLRRGQRADTDPASSHLGLGLFIVKQIALAHGGTVAAESGAGRTVFNVEMPRAAAGS